MEQRVEDLRQQLAEAKLQLEALHQQGAAAPGGVMLPSVNPRALQPGEAPPGFHPKARSQDNPEYPARQPVSDEQVHWRKEFRGYAPQAWTHDTVFANSRELSTGAKWADPKHPPTAELEQRTTFSGDGRAHPLGTALSFEDGVPLNPVGRTGIKGRGLLGKWGPNQAADPIMTRYDPEGGRLQIVVIQRKDTNQVQTTCNLQAHAWSLLPHA